MDNELMMKKAKNFEKNKSNQVNNCEFLCEYKNNNYKNIIIIKI